MARLTERLICLDDHASPDETVIDYVEVGEAVRRTRRLTPKPASRREAIERRHCYWSGLHAAGATLEEIADDAGFAVSTVEYGVKQGRKILAREFARG